MDPSRSVSETNVPHHMQRIIHYLIEEENYISETECYDSHGNVFIAEHGECLEYMLQKKVFEQFVSYADKDVGFL